MFSLCVQPRRNSDFAIETIQILTQWLRRETKITRATLHGGRRDDPTASSLRKSLNRPENVEVFKVMCYDTTSWVKENFEPQVKRFNETHEHMLLKIDYTQDRLDVNTASYAVGYVFFLRIDVLLPTSQVLPEETYYSR